MRRGKSRDRRSHDTWPLALEREPVHPLHQIAVGDLCIGQYPHFIESRELPIPHQNLAVDNHRPNVARLGTVDDLAEYIVNRLTVNRFKIHKNEIGSLSYFDRATERGQA